MKKLKILGLVLMIAAVFACVFVIAYAANTTSSTVSTVSNAFVEVYLDENGLFYAVKFDSDEEYTYVESTEGSTKITGCTNGYVAYRIAAMVNGCKEINGQNVYLYTSPILLNKAELFEDGFEQLPDEWQETLKAYGAAWARPLAEATLEFDWDFVAHRLEKYDPEKHIRLARLWYSKTEYVDIFTYWYEDEDWEDEGYQEFCLCYLEEPAEPEDEPDITPAPTVKPTPTATPHVTPDPTKSTPIATPRVTPEPGGPGDNGDGGYDENPLQNTPTPTPMPVASPRVTPETGTQGDNADGGYGDNNLNDLETNPVSEGQGGYGENPLNGNDNGGAESDLGDPATPGTLPETGTSGNPLAGDTGSSNGNPLAGDNGSSSSSNNSGNPLSSGDSGNSSSSDSGSSSSNPLAGDSGSSSGNSSSSGSNGNPLSGSSSSGTGNGGYGSNPLG